MKKHKSQDLSKSKKIIFSLVAVIIPFIFLIIFELGLRLFGYGHNLQLFIDHPNKEYSAYKTINPFVGEKYFKKFDATGGTNDIFLKKKPQNGYRIFVLGSSTVVGFPYSYNLMFSRILQARLQDEYPGKHIEIINTAITAINSYTMLDFMYEVVKYQPDAIILYEGHNEFYGAFGIGSKEKLSRNTNILKLHFKLLNLRIYQLLRNTIYGTANLFAETNASENKGTLMKRMVANAQIAYKSKNYDIGIHQFTENFSEILQIARKNKIPVFIGDLISNIKDLKPFGSLKSDTFPLASDVYQKAKQQERNGNYEEARRLYYYAKDLDCVRFRASEEINDTIYKLANRYNAFLVPVKNYFEQNSPHRLIGNNLVTEHLHPNIEGYFLMAEAYNNQIIKSGKIGENIDTLNFKTLSYFKRNWGYTELDSLAGLHKVNKLKSEWPFSSTSDEYDYRKNYRTISFIDSMAFSTILNRNINVEQLHRKLGEKYLALKDYYNAYREFHSLICINPYWSIYYIEAANCLLNLNDLHSASILFKKSEDFDSKNYYPYFAIGEINIIKSDFKNAIENYEIAYKKSRTDKEKQYILAKLYLAYSYYGNNTLAQITFSKLRKLNPSASSEIPKIASLFSDYIPYFVKNELTEAKQLLINGEDDKALVLLQKSLVIWDTPLANKYIGDILYKKRNNSLLFYYMKAYAEFKTDPGFLAGLCVAYLVNRQFDNASLIISQIKSIDSNYPDIPKLENLVLTLNKK